MTVAELKEALDEYLDDDDVAICINGAVYRTKIKISNQRLWVENGKKNFVVLRGHGDT